MTFAQFEQAPRAYKEASLQCLVLALACLKQQPKALPITFFLIVKIPVIPDDKEKARMNIIEGLNDIDWDNKTVSVRINGLDTHYMYRDLIDICEQAGKCFDTILIPKVGTAADVYAVDMLITQIEDAMGIKEKLGIECIIETALGVRML